MVSPDTDALKPGDFVRHLFGDRPYRILTRELAMNEIEIATVVDSRGRRRWYPIAALQRIALTEEEEATWCLDQLQR